MKNWMNNLSHPWYRLIPLHLMASVPSQSSTRPFVKNDEGPSEVTPNGERLQYLCRPGGKKAYLSLMYFKLGGLPASHRLHGLAVLRLVGVNRTQWVVWTEMNCLIGVNRALKQYNFNLWIADWDCTCLYRSIFRKFSPGARQWGISRADDSDAIMDVIVHHFTRVQLLTLLHAPVPKFFFSNAQWRWAMGHLQRVFCRHPISLRERRGGRGVAYQNQTTRPIRSVRQTQNCPSLRRWFVRFFYHRAAELLPSSTKLDKTSHCTDMIIHRCSTWRSVWLSLFEEMWSCTTY